VGGGGKDNDADRRAVVGEVATGAMHGDGIWAICRTNPSRDGQGGSDKSGLRGVGTARAGRTGGAHARRMESGDWARRRGAAGGGGLTVRRKAKEHAKIESERRSKNNQAA